jgi:hypothetical protein
MPSSSYSDVEEPCEWDKPITAEDYVPEADFSMYAAQTEEFIKSTPTEASMQKHNPYRRATADPKRFTWPDRCSVLAVFRAFKFTQGTWLPDVYDALDRAVLVGVEGAGDEVQAGLAVWARANPHDRSLLAGECRHYLPEPAGAKDLEQQMILFG